MTNLYYRWRKEKIEQNLDTSSSMKTRRGFTSDGLHFINSCRQLCSTLTGVTISAVLNPKSTVLIAAYKKAITCNYILKIRQTRSTNQLKSCKQYKNKKRLIKSHMLQSMLQNSVGSGWGVTYCPAPGMGAFLDFFIFSFIQQKKAEKNWQKS